MNWYRFLFANVNLPAMIAGWLQQLNNGPMDMQLVHRELDREMSSQDPQTIENAVMSGESMYKTMSGSVELIPAQVDLLSNIRMRIHNPQMMEGSFNGGQDVSTTQESVGMVGDQG